ncbi:MAG TPA: Xaa-Pro peptidase family protein [Gaiellales bacterium]|jgi:Xaa-Pro aminopeptidase|nr:Xaa-Pro peptidase family protein [Gaiellales bacterium]
MTVQPIAEAEYAERVARLRAAMAEQGLGGVIAYGAHRDYHPADLRYLARWYCVEEETAALYVPADGPTTLLTDAAWDVERAGAEAYANEARHTRDMGRDLAELIHSSDGRAGRVGIAGYGIFPAPSYLALRGALEGVELVDASRLTAELRMVKSPAELDLLRAASAISDQAMRAGLDAIRDGATETSVAAAAEAVIRAAGAEPSFVTEMGSGPRTALGTYLPGARRLRRGEYAVLDCGARVEGYHGDMCRTIIVGGEPTAPQRRRLEAVEAAVCAAIAAIQPGVTVGEIRDVAAQTIADAGFGDEWWDAFMPHGNGAGQHEPPNAKEDPDLPLAAGMVLCIEPGVTIPDEGAVVIEQMIAVTPDGAEVLNRLRTDMWDGR